MSAYKYNNGKHQTIISDSVQLIKVALETVHIHSKIMKVTSMHTYAYSKCMKFA